MVQNLGELLETAKKQKLNRQFEAAIETFQAILQKDPNQEEAYYKLAELFAVRGLLPNVISQYLKLLNVLENKGELDGSAEICKWAIALEPANTKARIKLIDILKKKNLSSEVIKQSITLSKIYTALGQGEQAISLIQQVQALKPDDLELTLQLGEMYIRQGQIVEGLSIYKQISFEYSERNELVRAVDILKRIKTIKIDDLNNLYALGEALFKLKRYDEAEAEFRLILRHDLSHIEALKQLGLIAKEQGNYAKAELPFKKIADVDPNNAFARECLGNIYQTMGDHVKAIRNYTSAAEIYERSENREQTIEMYQNILSIDPEFAAAKNQLMEWGIPIKERPIQKPAAVFSQQGAKQGAKQGVQQGTQQGTQQGGIKKLTPKPLDKPGGLPAGLPGGLKGKTESTPPLPALPGAGTLRPSTQGFIKGQKESPSLAKAGMLSKQQGVTSPSKPGLLKKMETEPNVKPQLIRTRKEESVTIKEAAAEHKKFKDAELEKIPTPITEEITQAETANIPIEITTIVNPPIKEPEGTIIPSVQEEALPEDITPQVPEQQPEKLEVVQSELQKEEKTESKDTKKFLVSLSKKVQEEPTNTALRIQYALILKECNFIEEALLELQLAVTDKPNNITVRECIWELSLLLNMDSKAEEEGLAIAILYGQAGDYDRKLASLSKIIALNPKNSAARRELIKHYLSSHQQGIAMYHYQSLVKILEETMEYDELINSYKDLLLLAPQNTDILKRLGAVYEKTGNLEDTRATYLALSATYEAQQQWQNSSLVYVKILSLFPKELHYHEHLRDLYARLNEQALLLKEDLAIAKIKEETGALDDAINKYEVILQNNPNNVELLDILWQAYVKRGHTEKVVESAKTLVQILLTQNNITRAIEVYQTLVTIQPEEIEFHKALCDLYKKTSQEAMLVKEHTTLGQLWTQKANFDEAVEAYKNAIKLDPSLIDARYQLGCILADHKNSIFEALVEFQQVCDINQSHNTALRRLALGYMKQGEGEKAMVAAKRLLDLDPNNMAILEEMLLDTKARLERESTNPLTMLNLGIIYRHMNKIDMAIEQFQKARKFKDTFLKASNYLGLCFQEKALIEHNPSMFKIAIQQFEKGIQAKEFKEEEYLDLHYNLGYLYERMGEIKEAISKYREVFAIDIKYRDTAERLKCLEEEESSSKVLRMPQAKWEQSSQ